MNNSNKAPSYLGVNVKLMRVFTTLSEIHLVIKSYILNTHSREKLSLNLNFPDIRRRQRTVVSCETELVRSEKSKKNLENRIWRFQLLKQKAEAIVSFEPSLFYVDIWPKSENSVVFLYPCYLHMHRLIHSFKFADTFWFRQIKVNPTSAKNLVNDR